MLADTNYESSSCFSSYWVGVVKRSHLGYGDLKSAVSQGCIKLIELIFNMLIKM